MNQVLLSGRITKDTELSYLGGSGVAKASFDLVVERNYQKDKQNKVVDFVRCEMLGKGAEALAQYLTKGKAIMVIGELNIDRYEKEGEQKTFTKVKVDRVEFQQGSTEGKQENKSNNDFKEVDNDDIPF